MVIEASGADLSVRHWTTLDMLQISLVQEFMLRTSLADRATIVSSRQLDGATSTAQAASRFFGAPITQAPQISLVDS